METLSKQTLSSGQTATAVVEKTASAPFVRAGEYVSTEHQDPISDSDPEIPSWKRVFDVSICCVLIPLLTPVLLAVALWIKAVSRGPAIFEQIRVGVGRRRFTMWKFRTMWVDADPQLHQAYTKKILSDNAPMAKLDAIGDPRLIPGGILLRASCLDELPQLFNVLRGEMSIVGPRPCLESEECFFIEDASERFAGLPGLTGSWQVNGKNSLSIRQMLDLDCAYFQKLTLRTDLQIVARTPRVIWGQVKTSLIRRHRALSGWLHMWFQKLTSQKEG